MFHCRDYKLCLWISLAAMVSQLIVGCSESTSVAEQSLLEEYILSNRIDATKSGSFYYSIDSLSLEMDSLLTLPVSTNLVAVHLKGSLTDGLVFADTRSPDIDPLILGLNTNLIGGLQQGLRLFTKYSTGKLYLPPSMAYGDFGDLARGIPAAAIVIYEVEMLNIYTDETAYNDTLLQAYITHQLIIPDTATSSIQVIIKSEGSGLHPDDNSLVAMSYSISSLEGDLLIDVNEDAPDTLDLDDAISGFGKALPIFGVGGEGTLLIPSQEAYGSKGSDTIPGYTPLVVDLKLLDVLE